VKTTIDIPISTYNQVRSLAEAQGISVEQLLAKTIEEKLQGHPGSANGGEAPWMQGFGALADLKEENAWIARIIEEEFEQIEPEDRQ
jgi:hypothetical protein